MMHGARIALNSIHKDDSVSRGQYLHLLAKLKIELIEEFDSLKYSLPERESIQQEINFILADMCSCQNILNSLSEDRVIERCGLISRIEDLAKELEILKCFLQE